MSRRLSPHEHLLGDVKEKELRQNIEVAAQWFGWAFQFWHSSIDSPAGFPDIVAVKVMPDGTARMLCLELKRETEKPTAAQTAWLALLGLVPGITARVIRPADMDWLYEEMQRP